ncbi:stage III sporulation protein SpoIIIAB [Pseudobacteroides cellulosolvens]|uniref:Stage III sporulation protein AB n=1 Tax=Pseudobacteroides cellulosolvens ATCC 35603 = DSM 2933 TaxID=398512 RepID=A0A0L6JLL6_9FIRM|nr:stage III sporulation protein SpoIIIAB [Pseudobacteroides cellulosolvens]KNY26696.1 stage III sporulation protein AB [Pseudobacteroides cellulosolvens ATCC 35603 = DSM 2933]
MLFKIIGSILILISSSFLGFYFSKECTRRPSELRELQRLLQMFENEISFLSSTVTEAFTKLSNYYESSTRLFFSGTAELLKDKNGINAFDAWEKAVKENIKKTALKKEDEAILLSFGKILGASDLEGQINNIRLTLTQLKMQEEKAEEVKEKNRTMYRNLGVLGGLAVVIVLI